MFDQITSQEKINFTKSLAIMLKSGITINEALMSLAEQSKSGIFKKIIYKIKSDVETGVSLSESLSKQKEVFGNVFIGLIKAGEASGTLEENLSFLADWLERSNDLRGDINAAMLYPKIVFSATIILGGGLSVFILPKLVPLFTSLRVELPPTTKALLSFSIFLQKFWLFIFLGTAGLVLGFILLNRIRNVRRFFHLIYIKMPFFGSLLLDYQLALISQLFSTLFKTGVSINESINIVSETATNICYQESLEKIKKRVVEGTTLSLAMNDYSGLYPKNMVNIISVGEKSGTLDKSFIYLSEFYSKEVNNKIKRLPTIIEPILLITIGLLVGFIAIAIIMPIYGLVGGLSG